MNRVDPTLLHELKEYGAVGIEKCFNCGNCTASCPLTDDKHPFPRDMVRFSQMGLRDRIMESTDAWQCYYCGECSQTCPKGAEPAETMMSIRRWLTAQYDVSGHGAKLYRSERAMFLSILRGVILNLFLLALLYVFGVAHLVTDRVELNAAFPVMWIWAMVLIHFAYLGTARLLEHVQHGAACAWQRIHRKEDSASHIRRRVQNFYHALRHTKALERLRRKSQNSLAETHHLYVWLLDHANVDRPLAMVVPNRQYLPHLSPSALAWLLRISRHVPILD